MRLANHQVHNLIHENESIIVRKYLCHELEPLQRFFQPSGSLNLNFRIELRYRLRESRRLSSLLAHRCCAKLEPRLPDDEQGAWRKRKTKKLRDKLMMSVFALYEFLNRLRQVIIQSLHEFEGCSTADFARLGFVLGLDQQRIFESFPRKSLAHLSHAWQIIEGVANSKGVPLSLKSTKLPYTTVKMVLVLGGLDRFTELMSKATLKERIQDLDSFNAEIWQGRVWKPHQSLGGPALTSIHHLHPPPERASSANFPKSMSPTAPTTFINRQHICEPSLAAVILRLTGTLNGILPVDGYICDAVKEKGDPSYHLLCWNTPDNPA